MKAEEENHCTMVMDMAEVIKRIRQRAEWENEALEEAKKLHLPGSYEIDYHKIRRNTLLELADHMAKGIF